MIYKGIRKIDQGAFIARYDVEYQTNDGSRKIYEMISRNKDIQTLEELNNPRPDSVILILTDESRTRILVNREFRMAVGGWVYNFPAGLIDPGETPEQSAKRELWEETGLELCSIDDVLAQSYSAVGFSNEKNVCILGTARGTFRKSTSAEEEIEAGWYTKEQMRALLSSNMFAARTQSYCYLWSRSETDC